MLGSQGIIQAPQDSMISNLMSTQDYNSLNMIQETNGVDINDYNVSEWIKCRQNPLYFILNYVYFKEYGGKQLYTKEFLHNKLRRVVRTVFRHHMAMLMASRQLGKSSIAAAILSWAIVFYPDNRAVIFNFQKAAAQENLNKVKFVIKNLPPWLKITVPNASRSEIKTYLELKNGSRLDTFYPSTTTSPDTLSRSLSVPIIYADKFLSLSRVI
jgi:hypothetical protein